MFLFDRTHCLKQCGDLCKALSLCLLGELRIHIGPLIVLTGSGIFQILRCLRHLTTVQQLEPDLCVFLFVVCRFLKQLADLYIAIFLRLRSIVVVLGERLRLAGKSSQQVLFRLCSL